MRKAGRLVAECLDTLVPEIRSGATTEHIDRLVFEFAMDDGATPATLMYRGYAKGTQPPVSSIRYLIRSAIPSH